MDLEEDEIKQSVKSNSATPVLDTYGVDLTKLALEGKIDPVVGREKEIDRIAQILSRRKKNNPILVGEPGCIISDTIIEVRKIDDISDHEIIEI